MQIFVCGVLNCTPDSFTDGDCSLDTDRFIERGLALIDAGADLIDIGGDSTRPGSVCTGPEEEWRRISQVLEALSPRIPISVDTHHAETARRSIEAGARYVNDISGGRDPQLVNIVARSQSSYIVMFNASGAAHSFEGEVTCKDIVQTVDTWCNSTLARLEAAGIARDRIILDAGMGRFLGPNPKNSWEVLGAYHTLARHTCALMLGCSRKGFLKVEGEHAIADRDRASALCGAIVADRLNNQVPLILRVHNVAMQREYLHILRQLPGR